MSLVISHQVMKVISDHALSEYPFECCGFIYGKDGIERVVEVTIPVINSELSQKFTRFAISPEAYMNSERHADLHHTTLLGVYHSHPDHPAVPSEYDLKHAFPFFSYIIVPVIKRELRGMRAWKLNENGQFEEEAIHSKQKE